MPAIFALAVAALLVQPSPPAMPQATPAQLEVFLRVLRHAPAFAAGSGRELGAVRLGMVGPDSEGKAFIVEFGWKEKGAQRTGLATLFDEASMRARSPDAVSRALARDGGWLLMNVIEDKTWDDLIKNLADRRRSMAESSAMNDIHAVIGAQAVYQSVVKAYAPTLACLLRPSDCIPGYKGPEFLAEWASGADRMDYHRALHPGRKASGAEGVRAVETWAYTAVPTLPAEGWRAFCGDHTGVVCAIAEGTMPPITDGTCPKTCKPAQ